jgi:hypothetical protein
VRLRAGAPLPLLVRKLAAAGWGDLRHESLRGVRATLMALGEMLTPTTGAGKSTARQIAHRTGYTERWTRYCLGVLEELELLEWHRGGIVEGKPCPSLFRISKSLLVELIAIAREQGAARLAAERAATHARIRRWGLFRTKRAPSRRARSHAEVSAALLSIEDVSGRAGPPDPPPRPADQCRKDYYVGLMKTAIQESRRRPVSDGSEKRRIDEESVDRRAHAGIAG